LVRCRRDQTAWECSLTETAATRWRRRKVERGFCSRCSAQAATGHTMCRSCLDKHAIYCRGRRRKDPKPLRHPIGWKSSRAQQTASNAIAARAHSDGVRTFAQGPVGPSYAIIDIAVSEYERFIDEDDPYNPPLAVDAYDDMRAALMLAGASSDHWLTSLPAFETQTSIIPPRTSSLIGRPRFTKMSNVLPPDRAGRVYIQIQDHLIVQKRILSIEEIKQIVHDAAWVCDVK
jgi:hypothetical protein